mgnify:FL=1
MRGGNTAQQVTAGPKASRTATRQKLGIQCAHEYGRNNAMIATTVKRKAAHQTRPGDSSPVANQRVSTPAPVLLANEYGQDSTRTADCTRPLRPAILHVQAAAPSAVVLSVAKLRNDDTHSGLTLFLSQHCPPSTTRLTTPKKRGRRPRCSRQYMNAASATESTR